MTTVQLRRLARTRGLRSIGGRKASRASKNGLPPMLA
jgi:hypothetical protein